MLQIEKFVAAVLCGTESTPCGTAFVIARRHGLLVTAYHVLQAALSLPEDVKVPRYSTFRLQFPVDGSKHEAHFIAENSDAAADIATLRVASIPSQVVDPSFGGSTNSIGNNFASSGYREAVPGGAVGTIAPSELEPTKSSQKRLILKSSQLDTGMSGAPVVDLSRNCVIGMVVSVWVPRVRYGKIQDGSAFAVPHPKDRDTAFAVPIESVQRLNPEIRIASTKSNANWSVMVGAALAGAGGGLLAGEVHAKVHGVEDHHDGEAVEYNHDLARRDDRDDDDIDDDDW